MLNDYTTLAKQYATETFQGTIYLAFRDIPHLIKKHIDASIRINEITVIDYGCGAGRSTLFLKSLGFTKTVGVDIHDEMIHQARLADDNGVYFLIDSAETPFNDNSISFAFSSLVMLEIKTKQEMVKILSEIRRILTNCGIFIIVTGTAEVYDNKHQWLSVDVDYPENTAPNSGDVVKILLKNSSTLLFDYYWKESDYDEVIQQSGLKLIEKIKPIGHPSDGFEWKSENTTSPFLIYVLGKEVPLRS